MDRPLEVPPELRERLLRGEITLGEFLGLTQETLYAIAAIGHQLLKAGKHSQARDIFRGLVAASPYDSVFRCNLGATYANLELTEEALEQFSVAVQLNPVNVDALAARAEIYAFQGRRSEALGDAKAVLAADPDGKRAATPRARAVLSRLGEEAAARPSRKPGG